MRAKLLLVLCLLAGGPAHAQNYIVPNEKSATKQGFAFPKDAPVSIVLFRPDIHVSEQTAGGLDEPKPEWANMARTQLSASIAKMQAASGFKLVPLPDENGAASSGLDNYLSLFRAVVNSAMSYQLFPDSRLPTKSASFNWTLGPEAKALLPAIRADFGLFISTTDSYPSPERLKMEALRGDTPNIMASGGRSHIGYAALVDLRSGDIVWINTNVKMRGVVHTSDGADLRVSQLLRSFPALTSAASGKAK